MGDIYSAENAHEWNSEILRLIAQISYIKQDFNTPRDHVRFLGGVDI